MVDLVPFKFRKHEEDRARTIQVTKENMELIACNYPRDFGMVMGTRLLQKRDHRGRLLSDHPMNEVPEGDWIVRELDGMFYIYTDASFRVLFKET